MRHALLLCVLAGAAATSLRADTPAADPVAQLQQSAAALQAYAEKCAGMQCKQCDCAAMAQKAQGLIDAETAALALHRALIEQDAWMRAVHNNAISNNLLTGTLLAQLQDSLTYQE